MYNFNGEISMEYFNVGVSISGFAMNGLFFCKINDASKPLHFSVFILMNSLLLDENFVCVFIRRF